MANKCVYCGKDIPESNYAELKRWYANLWDDSDDRNMSNRSLSIISNQVHLDCVNKMD